MNLVSLQASYAVCEAGIRTCQDGSWGPCVPTGARQVEPLGQRWAAVGVSAECTWNPCNPYCHQVDDGPESLDLATVSHLEVGSSYVTSEHHQALPPPACTELAIIAPTEPLLVTSFSSTSPVQVRLKSRLYPEGCSAENPSVLWSIDRHEIATIGSDGTLTLVTPATGAIGVTAYAGQLTATSTVQVRVNVTDVSAAPAGTLAGFEQDAAQNDTATVLYPYPGTVLPLGLPAPVVQWDQGTVGASAVQLTLRYYDDSGDVAFRWAAIMPESSYLPLNPPSDTPSLLGPRVQLPQQAWASFEQSARGHEAEIALQRLNGTTLLGEIWVPIRFASGALRGSVYYQSYGTQLVNNFGPTASSSEGRFGAAVLALKLGKSSPEVTAGYTAGAYPSDGTGCRGCHSISASESVLLVNRHLNDWGWTDDEDSLLLYPSLKTPSGGYALSTSPTSGRFSFSAIHPTQPYVFTHAGPSETTAIESGATPPGGLTGSASAYHSQLYSLDPATFGQVAASSGIPSGLQAALPVFSPEGDRVAFTHYAGTVNGIAADKRSLATMDFAVVDGQPTFSGFRRLLTESTIHACSSDFGSSDPCTSVWPSFLPQGAGVVFEREVLNNGRVSGATRSEFGGTRAGCSSTESSACAQSGARGELWWVTLDAQPQRTRLSAANGKERDGAVTIPTATSPHDALNEPLLNYQPSASPAPMGGYHWVVFTSRRLYGNVATLNPWESDPRYAVLDGTRGVTTKKLWVAALKIGAEPGTDPSSPAFYLPGQELLAANFKPTWALPPCREAQMVASAANECLVDEDCCGAPAEARCVIDSPLTSPPTRHCVPVAPTACIEDGAATPCTSDAECCGFASGSHCASGACQSAPPPVLYDVGEFSRDFAAECPRNMEPVWRELQWKATIPDGSSIEFTISSAPEESGLDAQTAILVVPASGTFTPSQWRSSALAVDQVLREAAVSPGRYLRLRVRLLPSSDQLSAPTLWDWRQLYDCLYAL